MRRRWLWLGLAALLLAVAALLMTRGERPPGEAARPREVAFPRYPRGPQLERMKQRRTLAPASAPAAGAPQEERNRDPVLTALPGGKGVTAVVVEANALVASPVGRLLLNCLGAGGGGDPFAEVQAKTGIDLRRDVDRVAVFDDGFVVSGDFKQARFGEALAGAAPTKYGDRATLYDTGAGGQSAFALWGGTMVVAGTPAAVRGAVDRLEGRAPAATPAIPAERAFGDVYGVVGGQLLGRLLGGDQSGLARQFRAAAERIELHVDAAGDVALVAAVRGSAPAQVEDLGKALGAALAVARVQAQASGDTNLAELLDFARVVPEGASFTMELALPQAYLEKRLAECGRREPASASAPASAPAGE
ncbi:MAG TPA: hypothetical protein VGQ83_22810 [Polyangia bacterium]|jgi:hypothetical protein